MVQEQLLLNINMLKIDLINGQTKHEDKSVQLWLISLNLFYLSIIKSKK